MNTQPTHLTLAPVPDGTEAFALAKAAKEQGGVIYIARDDARMECVAQCLAFFFPEAEVLQFPAWDTIPYDRISPNNVVVNRRVRTLSRLAQTVQKNVIILTTVNAATQRVLSRDVLKLASLSVKAGDEIDRATLTQFLVHNGYVNSGTANEPGEFAVRGSIIDIVAAGASEGVRLDFFGDSIESIRAYDPATQITLPGETRGVLELLPASEVLLNEQSIQRFRNGYRALFGAVIKEDTLYDAVSVARHYAGTEHWLPLFYEKLETLFDYAPAAALVFDHLAEEAAHERFTAIADGYAARKDGAEDSHYKPIPPEMLYLGEGEWKALEASRATVHLHPYALPDAPDAGFQNTEWRAVPNFAAESVGQKKPVFELVGDFFREHVHTTKPLIACVSEGSRARMEKLLAANEIQAAMVSDWSRDKKTVARGKVGLCVLPLDNGFVAENIALLTEQDILGEKLHRATGKRKRTEHFLEEASTLQPGDLVVHREHGIGRFSGLETLEVQGTAHAFLKLLYLGDDRLYVPVENIDLISRYGSSDMPVELDKLGGLGWQQRTSKLKARIKVTAEELIGIAAERAMQEAPVFYAEGAYEQFCARFPYTETDDQLRAIEEVLQDLTSGKPMDRLVCGDVGFGKTEVALRAAFVASAAQGAQVAVVTPTTLLARQHYENFSKRFAGFPTRVRMLSRLVPAKEQEQVKEELKDGTIDIVIGTHALLSKEIQFKNLALLIVDEEQHFGVKQKERLKKIRTNTHVLTLTATPIPRTLQLSLAGIRELSIIATPPVDRLAVRTYVMPYDGMVIREALLREHYRGGRSFYVCPRISDLEEVETRLKNLVPELKTVIAHGQMPPEELENIMQAFIDGKYDVLLSTTIIESGLDIPQANTMVVHRSDRYGLSQLYQLRGRVGRAKIRAYAYLTLPAKQVTENAMKRLDVMHKLDTLGAGFSLASHDMDIRGFGNLLGDAQSGQVREVGVELYQHLLREAIEQIRTVDKQAGLKLLNEQFSAKVNLGVAVMIPETYVEDLPLRLGLYRRIAYLQGEAEVEAMAAELVDRFGPIPAEVENLLTTVKLKSLCQKAGIAKVDAGPKGAVIEFHNNQFAEPEELVMLVAKQPTLFKLRADSKLAIIGREWEKLDVRLKGVGEVVQDIAGLAA